MFRYLGLLIALVLSAAWAADDYSQWPFVRNIILKTTASGAATSGPVTKFPVLIRLKTSDSLVFKTSVNQGQDVRFATSAGVQAPYQIERWDSAGKVAELWVLVDTVKAGDSAQFIQMFWGKSTANDGSRPGAVFDTANGFAAVYHLGENGNTASGGYKDATSNANNGTGAGLTTTDGITGKCGNFDGSTGFISVPNATSLNPINITVSVWINPSGWTSLTAIVSKQDAGSPYPMFDFRRAYGSPKIQAAIAVGSSEYSLDGDSISIGTWQYVSFTYNGKIIYIYKNGVLKDSNTSISPSGSLTAGASAMDIGQNTVTGGRFFQGKIDEVVISKIARSADWITLCYKNQLAGDSLTQMGAIVQRLLITQQPVSDTVSPGDTARFVIKASGPSIGYQWYKLSAGTAAAISGATNDVYKFLALATDDTTIYKCRVKSSATQDSAWSAPCTLHVSPLPVITVQPVSRITARNGQASFFVKAVGAAPLTYQWSKNDADISSGVKDTLKLDSVKRTDNATIYKCKISNSAGSIVSVPCTLRVVAAIFGAAPLSGSDTLTVFFSDSSTGGAPSAPLKRAWRFGDGATAIDSAAVKYFYTAPNTNPYTATLVVSVGSVSDSAKKSIQVNALPLISGFFPDTAVSAKTPCTVTFTDTSKGTIYKRLWTFGDGDSLRDSATRAAVKHTYMKFGTYSVGLSVFGPAGGAVKPWANCIYIFNPDSGNPIRLSGRQKAADTLAIVLSNFAKTLRDSGATPYVNKVELWGAGSVMPSDTLSSAKMGSYSLQSLKSAGDPCTVAVAVPGAYRASDSVGIVASVLWNNGSRTAFQSVNGTFVTLRDTTKPFNPLTVSGAYRGDSTVEVYLDGMNSVDTVKIPTVKIEYDSLDSVSFTGSTAKNFSSGTLLSQSIKNNGRATVTLCAARFIGPQKAFYFGVSLQNADKVFSNRKIVKITVGLPANPVRLSARSLGADKIELSWPAISGIDSVRIWYSNAKPVPFGSDNPGPDFTGIIITPVTATADTFHGLQSNTRYYFGAQVAVSGIWSAVFQTSTAEAKTDSAVGPKIVNTISVETAVFDSTKNCIIIVVHVDTAGHGGDTLDAGLSWSTDSASVEKNKPMKIKASVKPRDTLVAALDNNVLFSAKYYFGLWLRKAGSSWMPPADSSRGTVKTPAFGWQIVKYGNDTGYHVAYADNGGLRISIDSSAVYPNHSDSLKILRWAAPDSMTTGCIVISRGYVYDKVIPSSPIFLGLKYASIPIGRRLSDVRIYRSNGKGLLRIDRSSLYVDSVGGYVSILTRDLADPFIALIDTVHPQIRSLTALTNAVKANEDIIDSFAISDNISNLSWHFLSARGGSAFDTRPQTISDTGTFSAYSNTISTLIEGGTVSGSQGLRAMLIVDDGVHIDTLNVSRRVIRDSISDVVQTQPNKWIPLRVTAYPDKPGVRDVLAGLAPKGKPWKYDNTQFRLFRWYAYSGNIGQPSQDKWVEYADSTDSLFSFVPGRVYWIKTRAPFVVDFGRSITPDLTRSDTIIVKPKTWTDFSTPYCFDVKLGDMLDATKDSLNILDSVNMITWKTKVDSGSAPSSEVYFPLMSPTISDPTVSIATQQDQSLPAVYSVYNPCASALALAIPPLPVPMSKYTGAVHAKRKGPASWLFKVNAWTSPEALRSIGYCSFKEGSSDKRYYPAAPTMGENAMVRFCNREGGRFGYAIHSARVSKEGGVTYTVALSSASGQGRRIFYSVEAMTGLPGGMRLVVINPMSGAVEPAQGVLAADCEENGTAFRQLVIGTEAYIAGARALVSAMRLALVGVHPNPFKRSLRIRYAVPFTGLQSVQFSIVNPSGREIWNKDVSCAGRVGPQELVWNGASKSKTALASGMYIVRMTALSTTGVAGVFEKKVMYLP